MTQGQLSMLISMIFFAVSFIISDDLFELIPCAGTGILWFISSLISFNTEYEEGKKKDNGEGK